MKKKSSIILHSLFFVICSVLAVLCLYHIISIRRLNVKYTPAMTEESSRELDNPFQIIRSRRNLLPGAEKFALPIHIL